MKMPLLFTALTVISVVVFFNTGTLIIQAIAVTAGIIAGAVAIATALMIVADKAAKDLGF